MINVTLRQNQMIIYNDGDSIGPKIALATNCDVLWFKGIRMVL